MFLILFKSFIDFGYFFTNFFVIFIFISQDKMLVLFLQDKRTITNFQHMEKIHKYILKAHKYQNENKFFKSLRNWNKLLAHHPEKGMEAVIYQHRSMIY